MIKKALASCLLVLTIFFIATPTIQAQTITTLQQKVVDYQLPYPGLLPDNPLYFIKQIRDSFMLFMASDQLKKEEVKLQISDKNISAAIELTKKGRHKLSVAKVEEAEAEFLSIVDRQSKEKKKNKEFIDTLRKANLKHREAIENLMKDMPQGQVELMQKQREKNMDIGKKLAAIKS
jgi:hypothetical protein